MDLILLGNSRLRSAIRQNAVSFPSQIPVFMKRGDVQERMVQLYFVRGWPMAFIAQRYGVTKSGVRKWLTEWRIRAVAAGYIQYIQPEDFSAAPVPEVAPPPSGDVAQSLEISDFADSEFGWEIALPPELEETLSISDSFLNRHA